MFSGSLALLYSLLGFQGGGQGSSPDRGQSLVEWYWLMLFNSLKKCNGIRIWLFFIKCHPGKDSDSRWVMHSRGRACHQGVRIFLAISPHESFPAFTLVSDRTWVVNNARPAVLAFVIVAEVDRNFTTGTFPLLHVKNKTLFTNGNWKDISWSSVEDLQSGTLVPWWVSPAIYGRSSDRDVQIHYESDKYSSLTCFPCKLVENCWKKD